MFTHTQGYALSHNENVYPTVIHGQKRPTHTGK